MAYLNSTRAVGADNQNRLNAVLATIRVAIERRRVYGRTFRELAGLTDRELDDLGISRSAIASISHEAAYGK